MYVDCSYAIWWCIIEYLWRDVLKETCITWGRRLRSSITNTYISESVLNIYFTSCYTINTMLTRKFVSAKTWFSWYWDTPEIKTHHIHPRVALIRVLTTKLIQKADNLLRKDWEKWPSVLCGLQWQVHGLLRQFPLYWTCLECKCSNYLISLCYLQNIPNGHWLVSVVLPCHPWGIVSQTTFFCRAGRNY